MLPQPQHKDAPPEHNHTPFAWIVADEAERTALTVTADQVGKRCWQKSDDTEWTLKSHDPVGWAIAAPVQSVAGKTGDVSLTKSDVGLASVDNTSDADKPVSTAQQLALNGKVDKVTGKGLSTEDYTTAEQSKLAAIEAGATKNATDDDLRDRSTHTGTQPASTITGLAPVATSGDYNALTNKPDLSALEEVNTYADLASFPATGETNKVYIAEDTGYVYRWNGSTYTQLTDQTAIWGQVSGDLANQSDLSNALAAKVDKVAGKGLSANDYTDTEKSKLAGIESGATGDQTKADIDALNIDADTVDGKHASDFDPAGTASSAVSSHESNTSAHAASAITYDNSASSSPETKVQGAIDDIYDRIKAKPYGPGPQQLIAGDMTDGFFGEVTAEELFSGDELAAILAVTEGTAQNSNAGWLKFACDNKILFVAKKAFRHSISWDHLYSRGIVYGTDDDGTNPRGTATNQLTTVGVLGYTFKVRLLTGGNADPVDVSDSRFFTDDMAQLDLGGGSEWNRLMYRIHQDVPTDDGTDGLRQDRHGGPQVGGNWASYTNADLNIDGNGRAGWCQETTTDSSAYRVSRGTDVVAYFYRLTASGTISPYGWRPALELITNH